MQSVAVGVAIQAILLTASVVSGLKCLNYAEQEADIVWTHRIGPEGWGYYSWDTTSQDIQNQPISKPIYFAADSWKAADLKNNPFPPKFTVKQVVGVDQYRVLSWEEHGDSSHSRGTLAYDPQSKTGFYMTHSLPKFSSEDGSFTSGANQRAQTFLCVSFDDNAKPQSIVALEPSGSGKDDSTTLQKVTWPKTLSTVKRHSKDKQNAGANLLQSFEFDGFKTVWDLVIAILRLGNAHISYVQDDTSKWWKDNLMAYQYGDGWLWHWDVTGSNGVFGYLADKKFRYLRTSFTSTKGVAVQIVIKPYSIVGDVWVEAVAPMINQQIGGGGVEFVVKTWNTALLQNPYQCCGGKSGVCSVTCSLDADLDDAVTEAKNKNNALEDYSEELLDAALEIPLASVKGNRKCSPNVDVTAVAWWEMPATTAWCDPQSLPTHDFFKNRQTIVYDATPVITGVHKKKKKLVTKHPKIKAGSKLNAVTCDHSKIGWSRGVSKDSHIWVCSGDLNRHGGSKKGKVPKKGGKGTKSGFLLLKDSARKGNNARGGHVTCIGNGVLKPVQELLEALVSTRGSCDSTRHQKTMTTSPQYRFTSVASYGLSANSGNPRQPLKYTKVDRLPRVKDQFEIQRKAKQLKRRMESRNEPNQEELQLMGSSNEPNPEELQSALREWLQCQWEKPPGGDASSCDCASFDVGFMDKELENVPSCYCTDAGKQCNPFD